MIPIKTLPAHKILTLTESLGEECPSSLPQNNNDIIPNMTKKIIIR
jgi:hypothetical protein